MEGIARTLTLNVEEYKQLVEDRASYQNEVYHLRKRVEELESRCENLEGENVAAHDGIKALVSIALFAISVAQGEIGVDDEGEDEDE